MESYGKFELLALLACGGMAEIFLARKSGEDEGQPNLVIKRILPHLAKNPRFIEMFLEEARITTLLQHPNIVPIYDVGHVHGSFFITMPYVSGLTVQALTELARERETVIPLGVSCAIVLQALEGLEYAHGRTSSEGRPLNLVHRDVTPSNLIIDEQGTVMLLDFGIAKAAGQIKRQTETGTIKGKLSYVSPEQARGEETDHRSDLFSLGIILHELVTGQRLFKRANELQVLKAVTEDPIPDPRELRDDLPPLLAQLINCALRRNPERRLASATEMHQELLLAAEQTRESTSPTVVARFVNDTFGDLLRERRDLVERTLHQHPAFDDEEPTPDPIHTSGGRRTTPLPSAAKPRRRLAVPLFVALVVLIIAGVVVYPLLKPAPVELKGPPLRLGITPYLPAKLLQKEFQPLARYLERRLGRPVEVLVPQSYNQTVDLLLDGELDLGDLPPYPYLLARKRNSDLAPLAMVQAGGASSYEGYLVVRRADNLGQISDLSGKRMCYVDPTSTSGYLIARAMVRKAGFEPAHFFSEAHFSGNHYQALRDLLAERCDVAAVYAGAYHAATKEGISVAQTRILAVSARLPYDVITASPRLPRDQQGAIRRALLEFDIKAELGREILSQSLPISGFIPAKAGDFDLLVKEIDL